MSKKNDYGNESIKSLKGAERVRKRPAVIFGDDGLEGCQHAVFEIISNSIDEARAGFGTKIIITRFLDKSIEVQDFKHLYRIVQELSKINTNSLGTITAIA